MMEWRWCPLCWRGTPPPATRAPAYSPRSSLEACSSQPPPPALRRDLGAETGVSRLDSNLARLELELRTESIVVCGTAASAGMWGISSSVSPMATSLPAVSSPWSAASLQWPALTLPALSHENLRCVLLFIITKLQPGTTKLKMHDSAK